MEVYYQAFLLFYHSSTIWGTLQIYIKARNDVTMSD